MKQGFLHSMETMGLVDGPGVRTVFFLQGCPLRCAYCHNPDSQTIGIGRPIDVEEIIRTARRYKSYYGKDGGVTLSGGEPLLQGAFVYEVFKALKKEGISTCLDTSGFGDPKWYEKVLPLTDTLLLDVKQFRDPQFKALVGASFSVFEDFMNSLKKRGFRGRIWIRHVMIPGKTDNNASMRDLVRTIMPVAEMIERIEILPYHTMGVAKYKELGRPYLLTGVPPMDRDKAKAFERYATSCFRTGNGEIRKRRIA